MKIVLASSNQGKIKEFQELLKNFEIKIIPQSEFQIEDAKETGLSFIENAIIKARHAAKLTGLPAIADDSGLTVDALNDEPGIFSARYAGIHSDAKNNIKKLLDKLKNITDEKRDASFHCALAFISHELDPTPLICTGKLSGKILREPKGEKGFGYDPIFFIPSENKTAAELSSEIKNKISHRGIALQTLLKLLPEKL